MSLVLDHLWQSTLVAATVAALTLFFPRQRAVVRFWLWFAASMKFLLPFATLAALGRWLSGFYALPAGLLAPVRPTAQMLLLPAYHLAPTPTGAPDAVMTCRVPRYLPGSRLKGPEVCKTNRIWALLRTQQWEIGPDGVSLISTANTVKPRTLASLAAACAALGCK